MRNFIKNIRKYLFLKIMILQIKPHWRWSAILLFHYLDFKNELGIYCEDEPQFFLLHL